MNMENEIIKKRCNGYTKTNKKCRNIIKENQNFYCCKDHEPYNMDIFQNGCFICSENINSSKELIYFKCKHIVHRTCYNEWLKYSKYDNPICILCRKEIRNNNNIIVNNNINYIKKNDKKVFIIKDYENNINYINNLLYN